MTTIIDIHLKDGRTVSGRADFGKGSPANPMSYGEVAEKFHGCCDFARWPKEHAQALVDLVADLESVPHIEALMARTRRS